ncbi:MAG: hypothetical protein CR971_00820 [candidate division SR1 bacterium]|nr:MAG: hypothetical protein CR971_00820 [candidate division SR1 bacterium]
MKYTKPTLSLTKLVDHLRKKGFIIKSDEESEDNVKSFLCNNGYYHTSSYMKCFYVPNLQTDKVQKENIAFINVIMLYLLDKQLQIVLLQSLLKIETFLKGFLLHNTSQKYKDPFWHTKQEYLTHQNYHNMIDIVERIQKDNQLSKISKDFFSKYDEEVYLPCWHLLEISSFGPFTKMFDFLKGEILLDFCTLLNVDCTEEGYDIDQFKGWLKGLCYFRNRIAHSEITWSIQRLPQIKLPSISKKLNTVCSYIQLMYHIITYIEGQDGADRFYLYCYDILLRIDKIPGITEKEKKRIGIWGNWKERFSNVREKDLQRFRERENEFTDKDFYQEAMDDLGIEEISCNS